MSNKGFLYALATSVMFGCGAVLAKIALGTLSPLALTALDLALGFVFLVPFLLATRIPLFSGIRRTYLGDLLLVSLVGTALPLFLVLFGLTLTTAIRGGILIQFQTVAGVLFAMGMLREKVSKRQAIGILLMLLGGLLVVVTKTESPLWGGTTMGDVMVLAGAVGFGYAFTPLRKLTLVMEPLQVASLRLMIGAVAIAPFLFVFPSALPTALPSPHVSFVIAIYVFTNFAFGFFAVNKALRLLHAWKTVAIVQTMPVFSTLSAIILLGESPTVLLGIGGALIIGGGILIARYEEKQVHA